jgi:hypothetical protein
LRGDKASATRLAELPAKQKKIVTCYYGELTDEARDLGDRCGSAANR